MNLMEFGVIVGIVFVIGISIWIYSNGLFKSKSGEGECEPTFVEKQYEPDYPVKELFELIIRNGYVKSPIDYGYAFNFCMNGAKYINQRCRYNNVLSDVTYRCGSNITWITYSETEWLYDQLESHYRKQKECEKQKQREEAGEWIKQELGATDRAKSVLQSILQWNYYFDMSQVKLTENELTWIGEQLDKGVTPNSD